MTKGADYSQAAKYQSGAAKAAKASGSGSKAPFWQWWGSEANKHSTSAKNNAQNFFAQFQGKGGGFKMPKFEMPVHVDVDFINPFVTSVKKASRDVWLQLPPPVRQAAPYVGASVGTGIIVFKIQQSRLDHANAKNKALEQKLEIAVTERDDAKILAKELKSQANRPQGASELELVAALSQATRAAAEAASAAAGAASICIVDPRLQALLPPKIANRNTPKQQAKKPSSAPVAEDTQDGPSEAFPA